MAKHLEGNISFWPRYCERQLLTNATEVITSQHSPRLISVVTAYSIDLPIGPTVKTLNIGTPRPATVVVLNIKQFNFTRN